MNRSSSPSDAQQVPWAAPGALALLKRLADADSITVEDVSQVLQLHDAFSAHIPDELDPWDPRAAVLKHAVKTSGLVQRLAAATANCLEQLLTHRPTQDVFCGPHEAPVPEQLQGLLEAVLGMMRDLSACITTCTTAADMSERLPYSSTCSQHKLTAAECQHITDAGLLSVMARTCNAVATTLKPQQRQELHIAAVKSAVALIDLFHAIVKYWHGLALQHHQLQVLVSAAASLLVELLRSGGLDHKSVSTAGGSMSPLDAFKLSYEAYEAQQRCLDVILWFACESYRDQRGQEQGFIKELRGSADFIHCVLAALGYVASRQHSTRSGFSPIPLPATDMSMQQLQAAAGSQAGQRSVGGTPSAEGASQSKLPVPPYHLQLLTALGAAWAADLQVDGTHLQDDPVPRYTRLDQLTEAVMCSADATIREHVPREGLFSLGRSPQPEVPALAALAAAPLMLSLMATIMELTALLPNLSLTTASLRLLTFLQVFMQGTRPNSDNPTELHVTSPADQAASSTASAEAVADPGSWPTDLQLSSARDLLKPALHCFAPAVLQEINKAFGTSAQGLLYLMISSPQSSFTGVLSRLFSAASDPATFSKLWFQLPATTSACLEAAIRSEQTLVHMNEGGEKGAAAQVFSMATQVLHKAGGRNNPLTDYSAALLDALAAARRCNQPCRLAPDTCSSTATVSSGDPEMLTAVATASPALFSLFSTLLKAWLCILEDPSMKKLRAQGREATLSGGLDMDPAQDQWALLGLATRLAQLLFLGGPESRLASVLANRFSSTTAWMHLLGRCLYVAGCVLCHLSSRTDSPLMPSWSSSFTPVPLATTAAQQLQLLEALVQQAQHELQQLQLPGEQAAAATAKDKLLLQAAQLQVLLQSATAALQQLSTAISTPERFVTDQLNQLHAAARGKLDPNLAQEVELFGVNLAGQFPVDLMCNNVKCVVVKQSSELRLIGSALAVWPATGSSRGDGGASSSSNRSRPQCRCSGCKMAYFCCVECQKAAWKAQHKAVCNRIKAAAGGS